MRPLDQFGNIDALKRVLEAAARETHAHIDVLRHLHEEVHAGYLGDLRPEALHNLRGGRFTLPEWLENNGKTPGVCSRGIVVIAGLGSEPLHVGITQYRLAERALQPHHSLGRDVLGGLRHSRDQTGVLKGKEPLWDLNRHDDRQCQGREEYPECYRAMTQHVVERVTIAR